MKTVKISDLIGKFETFYDDQCGNTTIMAASLLLGVTAVIGLNSDQNSKTQERARLQAIIDSAALAAIQQLPDQSAARDRAIEVVASYPETDNVTQNTDIVFGTYTDGVFTPTTSNPDTVEVSGHRTASRNNLLDSIGSQFIGQAGIEVSVDAKAFGSIESDATLCVLILGDPRRGKSGGVLDDDEEELDIDPGATVNLPNCRFHVNSSHDESFAVAKNAVFEVENIDLVGGFTQHNNGTLNPQPNLDQEVIDDPYADLDEPDNDDCGGVDEIEDDVVTLTPDLAFCDGLYINNSIVTFSPGVYVIGDELEIRNNSTITGNNVLIHLDGDGSDFLLSTSSTFNLSGREEGEYEGLVIWSDDHNDHDHHFRGTIGPDAAGVFYAPESQVDIEEDALFETNCLYIVALALDVDDDSTYQNSPTSRTDCLAGIPYDAASTSAELTNIRLVD